MSNTLKLVIFIVIFLIFAGPGLLLVNKPILVGGLPLLYIWALLHFVIQIMFLYYIARKNTEE